jgi:Pet100
MAKGRQGFWLEGGKFAVYLLIPIAASVYYNSPENQKKAADYYQYIKYPSNPATGWKEVIEQAASQQEQRNAYRQQLQQLNINNSINNSTKQSEVAPGESLTAKKPGWWRWIGWGGGKDTSNTSGDGNSNNE